MRRILPLVTVLVACGEPLPGERLGRRASPIQGGAPESGSSFAVAVLEADGTCSGTLLGPNLVLTARHCVANDTGRDYVDCSNDKFLAARAPSSFRVSLAQTPTFAGAEHTVKKVLVPANDRFCGDDIALLILGENATAAPATPAIAPALTDRATYGSEIVAIGYGTTGIGKSDEGTRRRRDGVPITCIPGDAKLDCNLADYQMTADELGAGAGLCDGDSGSGAYEPKSVAAAAPIVMGVLSRAGEDGTQCIDAIYSRTDVHRDFLIAAAREAALAGGYTAPRWADPTAMLPSDAGLPMTEPTPQKDPPAPASSAQPTDETTTTSSSSCAVAPRGDRRRGAGSVGLAFAAVVALLGARRRRRTT